MLHQNAMRAYQQAEQNFLVEGADPHGLVHILYAELLASIERADLAMEIQDLAAKSAATSKILSILYVLTSSLDFEKGGEVAVSLAQLYDWSRRQVIGATRDNSREGLAPVRNAISEIAEAWTAIAVRAA
jgi:flagellar protein FliS